MDRADPIDSRLELAPTPRRDRCKAGQLINAYWRVNQLRCELTQAGNGDRELATALAALATALAALDAVALALAGAAMTALERETAYLFTRSEHEADEG